MQKAIKKKKHGCYKFTATPMSVMYGSSVQYTFSLNSQYTERELFCFRLIHILHYSEQLARL